MLQLIKAPLPLLPLTVEVHEPLTELPVSVRLV
jgi:hypothetical protein